MLAGLPAEVALRALLDAMESAGLGCTVVTHRGPDLKRDWANEALARLFQLTVEEVRQLPPMDLLEASERERLAAMRASMTAGAEGPKFVATRLRRPDGTVVPVEVGIGYSFIDGTRAVFAFVRDVSSHVEMERALRDSEERFRRLAEAAPDSITLSLPGGGYVYANPVAMRFLGVSTLEELANVNPWLRIPPERHAEMREVGRRLLAGEGPIRNETRSVGPGGREIVFESSLSTMPYKGETAIVSCARDVTERVELQAKLVQRDRLAAVGMLAAGVAHELNNPLTTLTMQTRRLLAGAEASSFSPDVKQTLGEMSEAVTRMGAIIAELLFMARPVDQPQAHIDVGQILSSSARLVRAATTHAKPIRLAIEGELPPVVGFSSKLGQVFLNVLRNADQAIDGVVGGEVVVCARTTDGFIEIDVSDNGPGISEEHLRRVAEPFFTTKPQGTGLGLWISQTLMSQHGGTLEVKRRTGGGTSVVIRVPASSPLAG